MRTNRPALQTTNFMENPASFDLNLTIQRWRDNLSQAPALRGENLDELEAHLRDSVAALETRGLSEEEAFVVACSRIGKGGALEKEFGKVNWRAVWLDRLLWMLIGFQLWMIISIAYSTTQTAVLGVLGWTLEGTTDVNWLGFSLVVILLTPVFLTLGLFLGWRFLKRAEGKARDVFAGLLLKPLRLALGFFLAAVCLSLLVDYVRLYWIESIFNKNVPPVDWKFFLMHADSFLRQAVVAVFIWILACKRLRTRMA